MGNSDPALPEDADTARARAELLRIARAAESMVKGILWAQYAGGVIIVTVGIVFALSFFLGDPISLESAVIIAGAVVAGVMFLISAGYYVRWALIRTRLITPTKASSWEAKRLRKLAQDENARGTGDPTKDE